MIQKIQKEKAERTCPVCFDDANCKHQAKIACCKHKFCFDCIFYWGTKCKNVCPLCKKKYNTIVKVDYKTNAEKIFDIPDTDIFTLEQESFNTEEDSQAYAISCEICNQEIFQDEQVISCDCEKCLNLSDSHNEGDILYTHFTCAQSQNLIDPYTGEYV